MLIALDLQQHIIAFDSANPSASLGTHTVTGLQSGDTLIGIDYRPATLGLYALGGVEQGSQITTLRLYTIDQTTGAATLVSPSAGISVGGASTYSFDFNPYTDQIRVIGIDGENFRLSPTSGTLIATDPKLSNGTATAPTIVGLAYTPGNPLANSSTLFGIDQNNLMIINGSTGAVTTVGSLGDHFLANFIGLDTAPNSSANAGTAFTVENLFKPLFPPSLVSINLATGATTSLGEIAAPTGSFGNSIVSSLAVVPTATFTPPSPTPPVPPNATLGERYVAQVFLDLLGRNASQGDITAFGTLIDSGAVSPFNFVLAIQQSPEYLTRLVNQDYLSILGRPADPTGLNGSVLFLETGGTNQSLRSILFGSTEYFQSVGGNNTAFLGALFRATTGQTIDSNSQNILSGLLSAGVAPTTVALLLLQTPAAAQQVVTGFFQTYLKRTPNAAELVAHGALVQAGQAGMDQALILSSQEFFNNLPGTGAMPL
jgi:hypothetical protein